MAQRDDIVGVTACIERRDQALEVDLLGVEQRAVHVEQDSVDGPGRVHLYVHLPRAAACWSASFRRHAGHRQSAPSVGIGRRKLSSKHQHDPVSEQENSLPHAAQASRRGEARSERSLDERSISNRDLMHELISGSSRTAL
ncbi:hypothetical protein chiPu_0033277 [Chiloscyllium punctatum]|uniref:Uncharacterized protein n=1 Tax=Chiloscyllium punctatum TaxID=137246 RepID=A0A401U1J5_CHIPU|nr:hypothetical protein [Chiloscyllium punctatum]